ncbi:MAG: ABC transporter permease [Acidobacteriota bacterium]|jgi:ABC-type transport system involved in multi-copper enzyme maturation permease subunit
MLWEIIKKEVRDQLLSLRLMLSFLLVLVLMSANALLFQAEYRRQLTDYSRDVSLNLAALARNASSGYPLFTAFSWGSGDQSIYRRPNPLAFIAEGHDKDLPNAFKVNAFRLMAPEFTQRGNPLLWRFDSLDWAFIVTALLSFTAIVLVYDAVNGEKQRGTLRLIMSQPVSRATILLGKYLSAVIVLLLPLTAGVLLNLLIIVLSGAVRLDADQAWRVVISYLLSTVYISIFVLLGLFLSARSKIPVVALVTGLLAWVLLIVVIPAAGNLIARGLVRLPTEDRIEEDAERAYGEAAEVYNQRHPHPDNWIMSGRWSPGEPLLRAFEAHQAWGRVFQAWQDSKVAQVKWGREIASFSPAGLLIEALESTVESGITHYENFQKSARRYQQELASYVDRKYPLDKVSPLNRETTDPVIARMKLDFESIPKFEDRQAPVSDAAGPVLRSAGILALINVVLFAAAFVSFLRYDVR